MPKSRKKRQSRAQLSLEAYDYYRGALAWDEIRNPFSILALETGLRNEGEFQAFVLRSVGEGTIIVNDDPGFGHTTDDPICRMFRAGLPAFDEGSEGDAAEVKGICEADGAEVNEQ
jgi:hypothetical protein